MIKTSTADNQPKPKVKTGSYSAVEAILHDHTRDIAAVETGLGQLTRDVEDLKGTNGAILAKLDKLATDLAHRPHVPSFRDVAATLGGIAVAASAFIGFIMWWNSATFDRQAEPLKSANAISELKSSYELKLLNDRLTFLESGVRWKPELKEWAAR